MTFSVAIDFAHHCMCSQFVDGLSLALCNYHLSILGRASRRTQLKFLDGCWGCHTIVSAVPEEQSFILRASDPIRIPRRPVRCLCCSVVLSTLRVLVRQIVSRSRTLNCPVHASRVSYPWHSHTPSSDSWDPIVNGTGWNWYADVRKRMSEWANERGVLEVHFLLLFVHRRLSPSSSPSSI